MSRDIANPNDQHRDPVLHVLPAPGTLTQSDLDHLCCGETRVYFHARHCRKNR